MSALDRNKAVYPDTTGGTPTHGSQYDVAATVHFYAGSLVFINSSNYAVALSPTNAMSCAGYAESEVDNSSGANGDKKIRPRIGEISLENGGDIGADDVGKMAFASDNQTVYLSSNGGTRCCVGSIVGINSDSKVRVVAGMPGNRYIADLGSLNASDYVLVADQASTANGKGASDVGIEDAANFYAGSQVESALTALGVAIGGTNSTTRTYSSTNVVANNDVVVTAIGKLDGKFGDIASTANAKGASLVGVEDAAAYFSGAQVEAVLAEIGKHLPLSKADPGTAQAIPVTSSAVFNLTVAAPGETNTLAIPTFVGQVLVINVDNLGGGGTRAITASQPINQAGNTVMTFASARDCVKLHAVTVSSALRWEVLGNDGVALS